MSVFPGFLENSTWSRGQSGAAGNRGPRWTLGSPGMGSIGGSPQRCRPRRDFLEPALRGRGQGQSACMSDAGWEPHTGKRARPQGVRPGGERGCARQDSS